MVPYVLLILALVGVPFVVNTIWPPRWQPLAVVSFGAGWLTGELALQHIVWQVALIAGLSAAGALSGWAGWLGLGIAIVDWVALAWVALVGYRAKHVVAEALRATPAARYGSLLSYDTLSSEEDTSWRERPRWFRWWRVALGVPLGGRRIHAVRNIDYWGDGRHRHRLDIRWVGDRRPEDAPVLIQIHGGAWIMGDKREQGFPLMHELASRGWVCVAINYRLGPKGTWPDHIVDCKRAIAWVREHIAEYGGDPSWIVITGGSAGGHLSSLAALTPNDPRWQPGFEDADTSVSACIPLYGVYDMTGPVDGPRSYGSNLVRLLERMVIKTDLDSHRELYEEASPYYRLHGGAPPFFVFHGTNDTLVPVENARRFVEALRESSDAPVLYAELPLAQHAFDVLVSPRCWMAVAGAVAFLESLRRSPRPA